MRIVYFTDSYYPQLNGVATSVGYFVKALREKKHKVYVLAPKIGNYQDPEQDTYRLPSFRVVPGMPDFIRFPYPFPHKSIWKIAKFDFDIVHAHGNGLFSLIGLLVARTKKVPFILTFHTEVGKFTHYFLKGRIIKPALANNILLKRFGNLCDGIIAPSEKMKEALIQHGVRKNIVVIPNFVNFKKFNVKTSDYLHTKYQIPRKSPIILSVGRLGKEKNFEFLIETFRKIIQIDPDAYLVIVGQGLEEMKLKKLVRKLNLQTRVILTGGVENEKMPQVYKSADIFVFPSVSEVHPMVTIEAALSGLPLIVAKDDAYKGVVVNNRNGFLLPLKQDLFVEKIVFLLKNPEKLKSFGGNSLQIVKRNFNSGQSVRKLILFYQRVIKTYKPPSQLKRFGIKTFLESLQKH